jgi:hypothetical protein
MSHYKTASFFKWAMLEGGNILILIFSYLEQNEKLLLFFPAGILIFWFTKPSVQSFCNDYNIAEVDRAKL